MADGIWRTIGGRRVFIKDGQSLADAMKESGKFPSRKASAYDGLMGNEYTGVKGKDAIDKLLEEKQGHVKGAFYRDDIGEIDIFWGDDTAGLCHIINQRRKDHMDVKKLLRDLPSIISRGTLGSNSNSPNRENIFFGDKVIVITYELRGAETTAVLTAFSTKKKV